MTMIGVCSLCGKPAGGTCRLCGRMICSSCADPRTMVCRACAGKNRHDRQDELLA